MESRRMGIGAFYEAFQAEEAKRLVNRFEFVFTPKHGSWLNLAEIELRVLSGQCLNRHIHTIEKMQKEAKAYLSSVHHQSVFISSLLIAFSASITELLSPRGTDNLTIPLVVAGILML